MAVVSLPTLEFGKKKFGKTEFNTLTSTFTLDLDWMVADLDGQNCELIIEWAAI